MMTTKQRLMMKAKARGMRTAEERAVDELVYSKKGLNVMLDTIKAKADIDAVLVDYPDYELNYVSMAMIRDFPDRIRKLAKMVADNHDNGKNDVALLVESIILQQHNEKADFVMRTSGFWILRHKHKIVCVATMLKGVQLTFITTMKDERRKGHAVALLKILSKFYRSFTGILFGAVYPDVLPLFEKAGWFRPNNYPNKDDSVDACPTWSNETYEFARKRQGAVPKELVDKVLVITPMLTTLSYKFVMDTF